jgi:4-amino-4-deoxy-L-arabinose transferase-like glycosyltransferase
VTILAALASAALVLGVAFSVSGIALERLRLAPSESLVAGAVLALAGSWCMAWAVFVSGCPLWGYGLIPVLAAAACAWGRRGIRRLWADPPARGLLAGQLVVTCWCVAFLSFVRQHTGGPWAGDWLEHWERVKYFLREWPRDRAFIGVYELPARPPLANTLEAAFTFMTGGGYASFQAAAAALSSLAYLPVACLAARFGGARAARIAAVLLMVSPLFMENATFPWTKLQAAFFILSGLYFFLRVGDASQDPVAPGFLAGAALGAAAVTHYSAGPYVVVLGAAWCVAGFRRAWERRYLRATLAAAAAGACLLALWFAWSIREYGLPGTFLSNSSVSMARGNTGNRAATMAMNLWYTVVPPQVRGLRSNMLDQESPWGSLRDQAFVLYQMNLLFAFGSLGWLAIAREAARPPRPFLAFWCTLVGGIVLVSFTTYLEPGYFGIAQLCLQPVVLLGLAFLASRWDRLGAPWKAVVVAGCAADLCLGIALNFAVEDGAIDRWLRPSLGAPAVARTYSAIAQTNISAKEATHLRFFADLLPVGHGFVGLFLVGVLCLGIARCGRRMAS